MLNRTGHNKALYSRAVFLAVVADYFTERGWMALFRCAEAEVNLAETMRRGWLQTAPASPAMSELRLPVSSGPSKMWTLLLAIYANDPMWIKMGLSSGRLTRRHPGDSICRYAAEYVSRCY